MQKFVEIRFPEDISYGSSGGPEFLTNITITQSGFEQRNILFSQARMRYNINYEHKNQQTIDELLNFFHARHGRAQGFRFKDFSDYYAQKEFIDFYNNDKQQYQLIKSYISGDEKYCRIITKPVANTIKIYINNKILESREYNIDYSIGIVTFNQKLKDKSAIYADFEFDVPVRFDQDYLPIIHDHSNLMSIHNIKLIELKV